MMRGGEGNSRRDEMRETTMKQPLHGVGAFVVNDDICGIK